MSLDILIGHDARQFLLVMGKRLFGPKREKKKKRTTKKSKEEELLAESWEMKWRVHPKRL
jgi:hypothetical protein